MPRALVFEVSKDVELFAKRRDQRSLENVHHVNGTDVVDITWEYLLGSLIPSDGVLIGDEKIPEYNS